MQIRTIELYISFGAHTDKRGIKKSRFLNEIAFLPCGCTIYLVSKSIQFRPLFVEIFISHLLTSVGLQFVEF